MNCINCKNRKFLSRIYEITICNYCIDGSNFEQEIQNIKTIKNLDYEVKFSESKKIDYYIN